MSLVRWYEPGGDVAAWLGGVNMKNTPVTTEDKKAWLSRSLSLSDELEALQEAYRELMETATSTTAAYGGIVVSGSGNPHKFEGVSTYGVYIKAVEAERRKVREQILKAIASVKDGRLRTLLIHRYVNCKTWPDVAEAMHYSERHIHNLHSQALKQIRITRSMIDAANRREQSFSVTQ